MKIKYIFLILLFSSFANATTYYVDDVNGNDTTGNGSLSTPYATITTALDNVNSGDTIEVLYGADGKQVEGVTIDAGSANDSVTIQPLTGYTDKLWIIPSANPKAISTTDLDYGTGTITFKNFHIGTTSTSGIGAVLSYLGGKSITLEDCNVHSKASTLCTANGNVTGVATRVLTFTDCNATQPAINKNMFIITDGQVIFNGGDFNNMAYTGTNSAVINYSGTASATNCVSIDVNDVKIYAKLDAIRVTPEGGLSYVKVEDCDINTPNAALIFDDTITSLYFNNNYVIGDDANTKTNFIVKAGDTTTGGFGSGWATDAVAGVEYVQMNNNRAFKVASGIFLDFDNATDYMEIQGNYIEADTNSGTKGGIWVGTSDSTPANTMSGGFITDNSICFTNTNESKDRSSATSTDRTPSQSGITIAYNATNFHIRNNRMTGADIGLYLYGDGNYIYNEVYRASTGIYFHPGANNKVHNVILYGDGYGNCLSYASLGASTPSNNTVTESIVDISGGTIRDIKFWTADVHWGNILNNNCYRATDVSYSLATFAELPDVTNTVDGLRTLWQTNEWGTADTNVTGNDSGSIQTSDCKFVNKDDRTDTNSFGDFHLLGDSPALGIGAYSEEFSGRSRGSYFYNILPSGRTRNR